MTCVQEILRFPRAFKCEKWPSIPPLNLTTAEAQRLPQQPVMRLHKHSDHRWSPSRRFQHIRAGDTHLSTRHHFPSHPTLEESPMHLYIVVCLGPRGSLRESQRGFWGVLRGPGEFLRGPWAVLGVPLGGCPGLRGPLTGYQGCSLGPATEAAAFLEG